MGERQLEGVLRGSESGHADLAQLSVCRLIVVVVLEASNFTSESKASSAEHRCVLGGATRGGDAAFPSQGRLVLVAARRGFQWWLPL